MTEFGAVFNNGRISAFYHDRNKDTLMICFAPRQKDCTPWGKTFLEKFDASILYLVDCRSSWFPVEDMITLKAALHTKLATHKKVMTFGFSMGGYAALKFSKLFNSNFNLVFSPQYSIDGNVVGHFDIRRPRQFFDMKLHDGMQIEKKDVSGLNFVVYDPLFKVDSCHVSLISEEILVHPIPTPFSFHDSLRFVQEAQAFEMIFEDFLSGRPLLPARMRQAFRVGRRRSVRYLIAAANAAASRSSLTASIRILDSANPNIRTNSSLMVQKARYLFENNMVREAAAVLDDLAPISEPDKQIQDLRNQTWRRLNSYLDLDGGKENFPHNDNAWSETAKFLNKYSIENQSVLAPFKFREVLPGRIVESPSPFVPANAHDWIVVNKGDIRGLTDSFITIISQLMSPVFANSVFIVWSSDPNMKPPEPFAEIHLQSFLVAHQKRRALKVPINQKTSSGPWLGLTNFLIQHVKFRDVIATTSAARSVFNNKTVHTPAQFCAFTKYNWIIIHKGQTDELHADSINKMLFSSIPVYANEVFVVYSKQNVDVLDDQSDSVHVKALRIKLERLAS